MPAMARKTKSSVAVATVTGDNPRATYLHRATTFWVCVRDARLDEWHLKARNATWSNLQWNWKALGISNEARAAAARFGFVPGEVFAHPDVIEAEPTLFDYYRMLACLPQKGLAQIMRGATDRSLAAKCVLLNGMLGELLQQIVTFDSQRIGYTLFAEAGSEWQGTLANRKGQAAALDLKRVIVEYVVAKKLLSSNDKFDLVKTSRFTLKSGTTIAFASEPDVEIRNAVGTLVCVIEIKGSTDPAGAQTRLGETKKSFAKAKRENRHCKTIFLPSVVTPAVNKQLASDTDIDQVFELPHIVHDAILRRKFLDELFHYILRER